MTQYTPGPWIVGDRYCVYSANSDLIVADADCDIRGAAREANARLIAAAPELLAVLQEIVRESDKLSEREFAIAVNAIDKATGADK